MKNVIGLICLMLVLVSCGENKIIDNEEWNMDYKDDIEEWNMDYKEKICNKINKVNNSELECQDKDDLKDWWDRGWSICHHFPWPKHFPRGQTDCYFYDKKTFIRSMARTSTNSMP